MESSGLDTKYYGKTLLCRTQYNGKNIAGRISLSHESINVRLVGFEDSVYFNQETDIPLQLEDNQFCTVTPASTSLGLKSTADIQNHYLDVNVLQAIIGFRPWRADDLVQEFQFKLSDTNGLLTAPDIQSAITSSSIENPPVSKILEVESAGTTVTISFSYTHGWSDTNLQVAGVVGYVTFDEAKTIEKMNDFIGIIRTFFTMAAGIEIKLSDYWIIPKENREQVLLDGGSTPVPFELIWPSGNGSQPIDHGISKPENILRCWGEFDRKTTADCLKFWMDNWPEWQHAFSGLLIAIRAGTTFNPNRIINACTWLESTPGAKQMKLNRGREIEAIATAAIAKANELGLTIDDRIHGAIKQLGTESRNDLFKRLIERVVPKRDPELKARFRKDLHKAYEFRGIFSHSKFEYSGEEEFGEYVKATMAVEALAFLMLFRQLPLPEGHPEPHGPNSITAYLLVP